MRLREPRKTAGRFWNIFEGSGNSNLGSDSQRKGTEFLRKAWIVIFASGFRHWSKEKPRGVGEASAVPLTAGADQRHSQIVR